jgi:hypothetical protein
MEKPTPTEKVRLISDCLGVVMSSPEVWREFEHEQEMNESFEDWALRRAEGLARKIWIQAHK